MQGDALVFPTLDDAIDHYRAQRLLVMAGKLTAVRSARDEGRHDEANRLLTGIIDECRREGMASIALRLRSLETRRGAS